MANTAHVEEVGDQFLGRMIIRFADTAKAEGGGREQH